MICQNIYIFSKSDSIIFNSKIALFLYLLQQHRDDISAIANIKNVGLYTVEN